MALYHFSADVFGRSKGIDATAAAAYRATCRIEDRTTGKKWDYSKKEKALYTKIVAPFGCPDWCRDRQELWNRVQEKENRSTSQFCRHYEIALQKELTLEQNIEVLENFVRYNFLRHGLVADIAIHAPHKNRDGTDNQNIHAHVMVTTRAVDINGWTEKFRAEKLPEYADCKHGQIAEKEFLNDLRKNWADKVNREFKKLNINERIDHRSLEEQGIDREPQQHQGKVATAMERKGKNPDRKKYKSEEIELTQKEELKIYEQAQRNIIPEIDTMFAEYRRLEELHRLEKQAEEEQKELEEKAKKNNSNIIEEWNKVFERQKIKSEKNSESVKKIIQKTNEEKPKVEKNDNEQKTNVKKVLPKTDVEIWEERINAMTPQEWSKFILNFNKPNLIDSAYGEYATTLKNAHIQANLRYIEQNKDQIKADIKKDTLTAKSKYESSVNKNPHKKPEHQEGRIFKSWITADGQSFSEVFDARIHQRALESDWQKTHTPIEKDWKIAKKTWNDFLAAEKTNDFKDVYNDLKNEKRYTSIFEKIKQGGQKLFEKLKEFAPVRAMVQAVKKLFPEKNQEFQEFQKTQKSQAPEHEKERNSGRHLI